MTLQESLFTPTPEPESTPEPQPGTLPARWVLCAEPGCYIAVLTLQMEGDIYCHAHGPQPAPRV
jgi:hypothetical protein